MTDRFELSKLIFVTIVVVVMLCFTAVGVRAIWDDCVVKDYEKHYTEQVYVDTMINQNTNLVFYRKDCPYCQAGKKAVITTAEKSAYPTFYINVESEEGQILVKKYQVEKAASLVTIRDGKPKLYLYAAKDKQGKITADDKTIKEALDDSED